MGNKRRVQNQTSFEIATEYADKASEHTTCEPYLWIGNCPDKIFYTTLARFWIEVCKKLNPGNNLYD